MPLPYQGRDSAFDTLHLLRQNHEMTRALLMQKKATNGMINTLEVSISTTLIKSAICTYALESYGMSNHSYGIHHNNQSKDLVLHRFPFHSKIHHLVFQSNYRA